MSGRFLSFCSVFLAFRHGDHAAFEMGGGGMAASLAKAVGFFIFRRNPSVAAFSDQPILVLKTLFDLTKTFQFFQLFLAYK